MVAAQPQFLLFCDAHVSKASSPSIEITQGRWHFMLERLDCPERLEVTDSERAQPPDRLALLAVVRGLEALEQPSQVTLITTSRYVSRGLRYGLSEWREADYSWEHFGVQKPIRNADLWQRIDGALQYHRVACRLLASSLTASEPHATGEVVETKEVAELVPITTALATLQAECTALQSRSNRKVDCLAASGAEWWGLAARWRNWWRGRTLRPAALAGI